MNHLKGPYKYVDHSTLKGGTITAPNQLVADGLSEIVAHTTSKACGEYIVLCLNSQPKLLVILLRIEQAFNEGDLDPDAMVYSKVDHGERVYIQDAVKAAIALATPTP